MTTSPDTMARTHPVHLFAGRVHQVLDEVGSPPSWSLSDDELAQTVAELGSAIARLQALQLALVADADRADLATTAGAVNTAGWLRQLTRMSGPVASRLVGTARALEAHEATRQALAEGAVDLDQARAVLAAVDALPDQVADRRPEAEAHLLECAAEHDARALRVLGRHVLEVVAPDRADELLAARLDREEARAARTCSLTMWGDGTGTVKGRFTIPVLHGAMLRTMVEAIANPARPDPTPREGAATPVVHGRAFCELLERIPATSLPTTGGVNATVVVTMSLDTLIGGLQAAQILGTDDQLSPGQARRLACAAGVIPAVLGGRSEVLDLGRRRRTHSKPQRLAMALRQGGLCNISGCDRPTSWADAHHPHQPWSRHGKTNLINGEMICPRHHVLVHQGHEYPRRT